jgi:hypothetical protein
LYFGASLQASVLGHGHLGLYTVAYVLSISSIVYLVLVLYNNIGIIHILFHLKRHQAGQVYMHRTLSSILDTNIRYDVPNEESRKRAFTVPPRGVESYN